MVSSAPGLSLPAVVWTGVQVLFLLSNFSYGLILDNRIGVRCLESPASNLGHHLRLTLHMHLTYLVCLPSLVVNNKVKFGDYLATLQRTVRRRL